MTNSTKSFISAQQVADLAGVSRSAVSRTFTEGASVSAKTRERVLNAAGKLGYHVNHLAKGLHDKSNIVSLITTDINTPFQSRFIDTLSRSLQKINKVTMLINTKSDDESVTEALNQTLNFRAEVSVVLSGQPSKALIDQCIRNGQRVILVNRNYVHPDADNIRIDNIGSARKALDILINQGCKNIALINSDVKSSSLMAREEGFMLAAKQEKVSIQVLRFGDSSYASGAFLAKRLNRHTDGVFCVTDLLACGLMDSLKSQGFNVPEDIAIVGFDDIEQASWNSYQLTTFQQPIDKITSHIIERVRTATDSPNIDYQYTLDAVKRKTTKH
ncbi:LacI family transcriptional regulator [Vibrio inusitatus NBRC 102082]|uniref:LacI family transcriptional regulator n=1 Tax=Vibrio inusitatus NBRC 102082 TaxID=1219070 RepID=A0A4Y3HYV9_9VIBR|nr:substrate-binding domain-containing protein [Vibrio inusitatus]GEA52218.1 LacI family transcriptional regulator [Vibrio inusitatus NBRC 102082]